MSLCALKYLNHAHRLSSDVHDGFLYLLSISCAVLVFGQEGLV